jgi:hypothetical protein
LKIAPRQDLNRRKDILSLQNSRVNSLTSSQFWTIHKPPLLCTVLPDLSSSSFAPKLSRRKLITFPTNAITFPPFITHPHTFESNQVPFLIAMSPKQRMTHLSQSKQKMNPAASAGVVLPLNSGRVSTSRTPHLPISVNSMPDDLKNMSLEQFLAFVPLEDCPVQPAEVPLTDEHQLTQKS